MGHFGVELLEFSWKNLPIPEMKWGEKANSLIKKGGGLYFKDNLQFLQFFMESQKN